MAEMQHYEHLGHLELISSLGIWTCMYRCYICVSSSRIPSVEVVTTKYRIGIKKTTLPTSRRHMRPLNLGHNGDAEQMRVI